MAQKILSLFSLAQAICCVIKQAREDQSCFFPCPSLKSVCFLKDIFFCLFIENNDKIAVRK